MSPDTINGIRTDYEAGMSYRELAGKHGTSKSTVARLASEHGWTKGKQRKASPRKKPAKRGTPARDSGTKKDMGQQEVSQVSQVSQATRARPSAEERIELSTALGTRAQKSAQAILDRVDAIIADPSSSAGLLNSAAQLQRAAQETITKSNTMIRLNAGLPTSYEKGETKTEGTMKYEYVNPEQIRESASEAFGVRLGRLALDPVPVAEGMGN